MRFIFTRAGFAVPPFRMAGGDAFAASLYQMCDRCPVCLLGVPWVEEE